MLIGISATRSMRRRRTTTSADLLIGASISFTMTIGISTIPNSQCATYCAGIWIGTLPSCMISMSQCPSFTPLADKRRKSQASILSSMASSHGSPNFRNSPSSPNTECQASGPTVMLICGRRAIWDSCHRTTTVCCACMKPSATVALIPCIAISSIQTRLLVAPQRAKAFPAGPMHRRMV